MAHNAGALGKGRADEVMTLGEVARYLRVGEKSVLRMVRRGEIPGAKVASQWRFKRKVIDGWLSATMARGRLDESRDDGSVSDKVISVSRLLKDDCIVLDLEPGPKEEILRRLTRPLVKSGVVGSEDEFVAALVERERMVSTGIGKGVAVPHVRQPEKSRGSEARLVFGRCAQGTDFGSIDGGETNVFFLVCAPGELVHLRIMAQLARVLRDDEVLDRLRSAQDAREIMSALVAKDQALLAEQGS